MANSLPRNMKTHAVEASLNTRLHCSLTTPQVVNRSVGGLTAAKLFTCVRRMLKQNAVLI